MFPPFFETIFWSVFIIYLTLIVFWWIALIIRNKGSGRVPRADAVSNPTCDQN